jgi:uncharacterized Zn finger protein (UPF0148 family)
MSNRAEENICSYCGQPGLQDLGEDEYFCPTCDCLYVPSDSDELDENEDE